MHIEVTDADVFASAIDDNAPCPIQMAMQRVFGRRVLVGPEQAIVGWGESEAVRYDLPRNAKKFIRRFDGDESVAGFEFELEEPSDADE